VLQHKNGHDRISELKASEGKRPVEAIQNSTNRTVGLLLDKKDKYVTQVQDALTKPKNFIMFPDFRCLYGKL